MADDKAELESFLNKVDQIEGLIKDLTSVDNKKHDEALNNADQYLSKLESSQPKNITKIPPRDNTGFNRTVINHEAFKDDPQPGASAHQSMSQEAFMRTMEEDARQRSERKKQLEKEANEIKEQGNVCFKNGDFQKAVEYYSKALEKIKDMTVLWTNRAQAYIKLGEYDKALEDCNWALRVSDKCLKAYIHQGKAYLGKGIFDKAIDSYTKAKEVDPKKSNAINEYISEAKRLQSACSDENAAAEVHESGDKVATGVVELLQKVNHEDQPPMYYTGGLQLLKHVLTSKTERTLFRIHGGLELIHQHRVISKCLTKDPGNLNDVELDLIISVLSTLTAACTDNDTNCCQVLSHSEMPWKLQQLLSCLHHKMAPVREAALLLLHTTSLNEVGRTELTKNYDLARILVGVFEIIKSVDKIGSTAAAFLNNLALDKRFRTQLRGDIEHNVLPAWENLIRDGAKDTTVLPSCVSTMTNLCGDPFIQKKLMKRRQVWEACCHSLDTLTPLSTNKVNSDIIHEILGLTMNLTLDSSENMKEFALNLTQPSLKLLLSDTNVSLHRRSLAVLSHLLPKSEEATNFSCSNGIIPKLMDIIQTDSENLKDAVKCICACAQYTPSSRQQFMQSKKSVFRLVDLLKHKDEVIAGNVALCLSNCCPDPGLPDSLVQTDIVMTLLTVARDAHKNAAQHNCGILLARLAQSHPGHLERLRELHGLEILHDVLKHVQ